MRTVTGILLRGNGSPVSGGKLRLISKLNTPPHLHRTVTADIPVGDDGEYEAEVLDGLYRAFYYPPCPQSSISRPSEVFLGDVLIEDGPPADLITLIYGTNPVDGLEGTIQQYLDAAVPQIVDGDLDEKLPPLVEALAGPYVVAAEAAASAAADSANAASGSAGAAASSATAANDSAMAAAGSAGAASSSASAAAGSASAASTSESNAASSASAALGSANAAAASESAAAGSASSAAGAATVAVNAADSASGSAGTATAAASAAAGSAGSASSSASAAAVAQGEANTAAQLSQAWAEGTEPGGPGTKSSREYADDAEQSAQDAAQAVEDNVNTTPGWTSHFWIPDRERAEIESASGGQLTIIRDDLDRPSIMRIIPVFRYEDLGLPGLGTGICTAFLTDGVQKSEILVGVYQAWVQSDRAQSLPGVAPTVNINFDNMRAACNNKGPGWHMLTIHERAAVSLWCAANGFEPHGNTQNGRSHSHTFERGRRVDGSSEINNITSARTLTGSGPVTWRHDGTWFGIADWVGNVWEWLEGFKLIDGRIFVTPDNDWTLPEEDWLDTGVDLPTMSQEPYNNQTVVGTELTNRLLLTQPGGLDIGGSMWANAEGERFGIAGGGRAHAGHAGPAALYASYERSSSGGYRGGRAAFQNP